jgi:ABC-type transport system involved in multi-copper enzyme maturation permease subunit
MLTRRILTLGYYTFKGGLRDRLVQSLLFTGLFFLLTTLVFSSFSMRQPLEVAINYSLATVQILAILVTLFLGLNLLSREIESRAGYLVMGQPISRTVYLLGKFCGLCLLSLLVVAFLGFCAAGGLLLVKLGLKDTPAIAWDNLCIALLGILYICLLLGAVTLVFTALATSAVLPFLMTIGVWFIGQSTQAVKKYLEAGLGDQPLPPLLQWLVKASYYFFPNLSLFDFKVYAIYGLHIPLPQIGYAVAYGTVYTLILLVLAAALFQQRDMT